MFDTLIGNKKIVAIRCGPTEVVGVISHYYESFGLLKIQELLLPLELIESIEVLDELPADRAYEQRPGERLLRLVGQPS